MSIESQGVDDGTERPDIRFLRSHWQLWRLPLPSTRDGAFVNGSESEVAEDQRRVTVTVIGWRAEEDVLGLDVPVDDWLPLRGRWGTTKLATVVSVMYER